jgi:hypothetical protein
LGGVMDVAVEVIGIPVVFSDSRMQAFGPSSNKI